MRTRQRDSQRSKCYDWEAKHVARDHDCIPFKDIQSLVNYVWSMEGLHNPPKVIPIPKQAHTIGADATRLHLRFHEFTSTKTILHEIAHAMTNDINGNGDGHGSHFVGTIMLLYTKYLNISLADMMASARDCKLKYEFSESVF